MHGNVFYWVINVPNVLQNHTLKSDDKLSIEKKESITDWSYQSPTISLQPVLIFVHILKKILKTGETYNGKKKKSFLNLIAYFFILLTQFSISISYINTNQNLLNKKITPTFVSEFWGIQFQQFFLKQLSLSVHLQVS